jgi:hypothetical protein
MFDNAVLRKIFGSNRQEITLDRKKLLIRSFIISHPPPTITSFSIWRQKFQKGKIDGSFGMHWGKQNRVWWGNLGKETTWKT